MHTLCTCENVSEWPRLICIFLSCVRLTWLRVYAFDVTLYLWSPMYWIVTCLSHCVGAGAVPSELGQLDALEHLMLPHNELSGKRPVAVQLITLRGRQRTAYSPK